GKGRNRPISMNCQNGRQSIISSRGRLLSEVGVPHLAFNMSRRCAKCTIGFATSFNVTDAN
ncbi:MAG: hypothetical protein ACTS6G_03400, partial [Candidatus Hodgkinia cicadicola]